MKQSDRTILVGVALLALVIAFWVMVLGPKRQEASDLSKQASDLQASVEQEQQLAAFAEQAKSSFGQNYHHLVVLGKAVPQDSDQASLLVQLNALARRAGVSFRTLDLDASAAQAAPTAPSLSPTIPGDTTTTTTDSTTTTTTPASDTTTASTPAATGSVPSVLPTEASAALTPIGSGVGPAGLPVMPYQLSFSGGFFQIADFLQELDELVHTSNGHVSVSGRLLTVNGFALSPGDVSATSAAAGGSPAGKAGKKLSVDLSVTTYLTPADQGLTGGATPSGPVIAGAAPTVPTSATTTAPTTTTPAPTTTPTP
jgi:Tfp pilus assembly protein PilO